MVKLIFIAMSLSLASCTSLSTSKVMASEPALLQDDEQAVINKPVNNKKPVRCYEPSEYDIKPELPDTGVRRETPIDVVPKELFIERLEASPLWEKISYSNHFERDFLLSEINGFLKIKGDGSFSKSEKITKVTYSPLNVNKRKKYGHQLLDQEKFGMTATVNLVINDHEKAAAILDQLYQKYSVKVENNDVLSDGETLHSYVRYNDILFEIWGINRTNHPIKECKFSFLTILSIS
ncbi:hypothetical protein IPZ60_06435 [Psychrobacter sp. NG25]|uniref:hypothetical protein n=1 Tax=Psychrobacter sp. NG25 TaxID=2782005 RepID=UPI0018846F0B|nr:hypothetical protein [Psychrobacter sp. NG25]MBF0658374.1 hypothetical protein [Psychrobacter sp. NG25]